MRKLKATALGIAGLGGGALLLNAISALVAYRVVTPIRQRRARDIAGPAYCEEIYFPSTDGLTLYGTFYRAPGARDCIILCHGFHSHQGEVIAAAAGLRSRGHNVFAFDFRGHGQSQDSRSSVGALEVRDLLGAVAYVRRRGDVDPDQVGVLGFSMGAAVAIMGAAQSAQLRAVVADSSYSSLERVITQNFRNIYQVPAFPFRRLVMGWSEAMVGSAARLSNPLTAISQVAPRPILIIHGLADGMINPNDARELFAAAASPKELWLVPLAEHVSAALVNPERYIERVSAFFVGVFQGVPLAELVVVTV